MSLVDTISTLCPAPERSVSAAQYVRMSTDLQQYSPEAQKQAIAEYAMAHGMRVVRTYEDAGLSGLTLRERPALVQLLMDVRDPNRNFDTVLVLDVSRWGRFQDADEAAYYEHECRRAGVRVVYCAEPFQDDGSPFASVYKSIKRAMAGEYSRELSGKVFLGHCRLVRLGFWQGACPGYGLRRQLVDANGTVKGLLAPFEHKAIQTDRVVLIPGPENEVALVRKMFDWYVNEKISLTRIANRLNAIGLYNPYDRPWNKPTIRAILRGEKYIGNNLYNRYSVRLHTPRVHNPPSEWVRSVGAFRKIVEPSVFEAAQTRLMRNSGVVVKEQIRAELENLFRRNGHLTKRAIDSQLGIRGKSSFRKQFGSMDVTYRSVGFVPTNSYAYIETRRQATIIFRGFVENLCTVLTQQHHRLWLGQDRTLLHINDELKVKLSARLCAYEGARTQTWEIGWPSHYDVDLMVVLLFSRTPVQIRDFYVLPLGILPIGKRTIMCAQNVPALSSFCFSNLDILSHLSERITLETERGKRTTERE
jgi:DNA invertase Pin-like site-specific DNA recombinase